MKFIPYSEEEIENFNKPTRTIVIKPGSNGARLLEELDRKKEALKLKLEERTELIREIGWDEYLKRRIAEGAIVKTVPSSNG